MEFDLFEYAYQEEKRKKMSETNKLEIIIKEKQIGLLDWNFEELNRALDESLKRYVGVQYTDDQIAIAKEDRARLNAFKKAINDRKIELKKEFCAPYDLFAAQVKELLSKVDRCAFGIDEQIKDFEEREKTAKRNKISDWWLMNKPTMLKLPIEKVMDEKWLNKSVSDKKWQKELSEKRDAILQNLDTIISWTDDPEKRDFCMRNYLNCLDFGQTMALYEQFKADKAKIEAMKAEAEQKRQETEQAVDQTSDYQHEPEQTEMWDITMRVSGTRIQMEMLGKFMKENGIWFKKVSASKRGGNE